MKPLEGITVLEFSTMITASFAAMMMAEQGARVIKVEPMNVGDPMRYIGANKGGISSLFANCNRGKQSIRVNLKEQAGQELIRELVTEVDVFIHNFRPGVMDKLNLGSDALRELNPRLIYAAISGFGKEGPLGRAPAYDPIIQAHAGLTATQGKGGEPAFFRTLICDKITAYTATQSICSALLKRERTGEAACIDLSMLDSAMFFFWPDGMMNQTLLDEDVEILAPLTSSYTMYECKDGAISIAALLDKHWHGIFKAIDKPELANDPKFGSTVERSKNVHELYKYLSLFKNYKVEEMFKRLSDNDVPCSKNLSLEELRHNTIIAYQFAPLYGKNLYYEIP